MSNLIHEARGFLKATLISVLALQLAVGCSGPADPVTRGENAEPAAEAPADVASGRLEMWTEIEGSTYSVDLLQEDARLTGVRTVTHADGRIESENIELSLADFANSAVEQTLTEAGLGDIEVVSTQTSESGTWYELETASGLVLHVRAEGDVEYGPVLAAAGLVLRTAIVVCGAVAIANITACSIRDRCWSYNFSLFRPWTVCSGSCQTCQ